MVGDRLGSRVQIASWFQQDTPTMPLHVTVLCTLVVCLPGLISSPWVSHLEKYLWYQIFVLRCKTKCSLLFEVLRLEKSRPYAHNEIEWGGRLGHLWHHSRFLVQSSSEAMALSHREAPSKLCLKVPPRHPHPRTSWLYLLPGNLHSQTFNLIFFSEMFLCSRLCGDGANSRAQRAQGPVHTPQWCIRMASPVSQAPSTAHHCTHSPATVWGTRPSLQPQSLPLARSLSGSHKRKFLWHNVLSKLQTSLLSGPRQIQKAVLLEDRELAKLYK